MATTGINPNAFMLFHFILGFYFSHLLALSLLLARTHTHNRHIDGNFVHRNRLSHIDIRPQYVHIVYSRKIWSFNFVQKKIEERECSLRMIPNNMQNIDICISSSIPYGVAGNGPRYIHNLYVKETNRPRNRMELEDRRHIQFECSLILNLTHNQKLIPNTLNQMHISMQYRFLSHLFLYFYSVEHFFVNIYSSVHVDES